MSERQKLFLVLAATCAVLAARPSSPAPGAGEASKTPAVRATSTHWIVTAGGDRIATRGPWKVQGKRLIFTTRSGILSSMRISEADLEASRLANEKAQAPPPPREERQEPAAPVLVLTDKDVSRAAPLPPPSQAEEGEAVDQAQNPSKPTAKAGLEVVSWKDVKDSDRGVEVFGTLRNNDSTLAKKVVLNVRLYDETETLISSAAAKLQREELPGKSTTNFRAAFPTETPNFDSIKFEIQEGSS